MKASIKEITAKLKLRLTKSKALPHLKSKRVRIGGAILTTVFLTIFTLPLFFDNSALEFQIKNKIGEELGIKISVRSGVSISFLPSLSVTLNDVLIKDFKPESENINVARVYNIYASKLTIKLPFFSFGDDFKIKEILFKNVILERYYDNKTALIRENSLTAIANDFENSTPKATGVGDGISGSLFAITSLKPSKSNKSLPRIIIKNGEFISYDFFGSKREVKKINFNLLLKKEKITAKASFLSDNILSNLKASLRFNSKIGDNDSFLRIKSSNLNLKITGDFTSENKILDEGLLANDFHGNISADIAELKSFYHAYFNDFDLLAQRLKYNGKPISLTSDLTIKEGELALTNLKAKSILLTGEGLISFSKKDQNITILDIDLNFENIDLDDIWSHEVAAHKIRGNVSKKIQKESAEDFEADFARKIKNIDLIAEIKAKNVKYLNGQVTDANLYLTSSNKGTILISPLTFNIPGAGSLSINGVIDNDEIHPKFIGKIYGNGENLGDALKWLKIYSQNLKFDNLKDYQFYSNILLVPHVIYLDNLYLSLNNNDNEILGELRIHDLNNTTDNKNITGRFHMSKFNVDDYFFTSAQNIYLSPGSLLKKIFWLNNINSNGDFDLTFDRLLYKNEIYKNQKTKFKFKHGLLEIYQASFNSDTRDLNLALSLNISGTVPEFKLKIFGKKLHYTTPQINLVNFDGEVAKSRARNFFDQIYALPSLEEFNGRITVNIEDLNIDDVPMKNLALEGKIKKGNIARTTCNVNIYGGDLKYSGFTGLKLRKTINGTISLQNAEINPLLKDVFNIKNIHGLANFAANVTAVASSKKEFLREITSEIKFSSTSPYIEGYGLSDLIKKMLYPSVFGAELQNPEKILTNKDSRTVFKQALGNFKIIGGKNPKLKIKIKAPAMNAILSGKFNPVNNSLDLLFNTIFITGTTKKQTPINIATVLKGPINRPQESSNIDQVKQYLGLIKPQSKQNEINRTALLPGQTISNQQPQMFQIPTDNIN